MCFAVEAASQRKDVAQCLRFQQTGHNVDAPAIQKHCRGGTSAAQTRAAQGRTRSSGSVVVARSSWRVFCVGSLKLTATR
jgi:hypothetical protein